VKTLDTWVNDNFASEEQAETKADVEREVRAIERARLLSKKMIDDLMNEHHVGFIELARKTHMSPSHLSAIMSGKSSPSVATLAKIAAAFGKDLNFSVS
jgi:transcriptional regulator with XRE-family HTH domain